MQASPAIPVAIEPEATALVAKLGMQVELDRMIHHMTEKVQNLQGIQVVLAPIYDTGDEPEIAIEGTQVRTNGDDGCTAWELNKWLTETFQPDVFRHFDFNVIYGNADAR